MYELRNSVLHRLRRLSNPRGVSLIEFMVALGIGMVLTLGILILMSRTSRSYKVSDEFARMQESGAAGIGYFGDDIRMAGFFGLAASTDAINAYDTGNGIGGTAPDGFLDYGEDAGIQFGTTAANDCGLANWTFQPTVPVYGIPGGAATTYAVVSAAAQTGAAGGFPCINAANYVPGSPVIVLRGATGSMVNLNAATGQPQNWTTAQFTAASGADPNMIYVQADPGNGFFFQGSQYGDATHGYKQANYNRTVPLGGGVVVDAPIYQYQTHIYYIRPCSRPTGGPDPWGNNLCQATDDNGNPIPTLARQEWQPTAAGPVMHEVGLVEGVEQMSLIYGLDTANAAGAQIPAGCFTQTACATPPDGVADTYTTNPSGLNPPNLNPWAEVVMVRVTMLLRSSIGSVGYNDAPKTYDIGGGVTWNCTLAGAPCNFHRHIYTEQIQVRNVAGRRAD